MNKLCFDKQSTKLRNLKMSSDNYFSHLKPKFEENDHFYQNLSCYIQTHYDMSAEQICDSLIGYFNNMDFDSDLSEIFVQVVDHDDKMATKVLLLLYSKLNILNKMDDEVKHDYLTCNCNDEIKKFMEDHKIIMSVDQNKISHDFIPTNNVFKHLTK